MRVARKNYSGRVIAVLCCAVLCCAVLCCAVLCCAVLCCAVLCCAVLCCAVLCCEFWHGERIHVKGFAECFSFFHESASSSKCNKSHRFLNIITQVLKIQIFLIFCKKNGKRKRFCNRMTIPKRLCLTMPALKQIPASPRERDKMASGKGLNGFRNEFGMAGIDFQ
ncbi:hypothetical protein TresaDRAFT_1591 [Treponema saccharophilum DSM 2985]|uniref:Uncharacterized protein n=1 Tax=Treponema saccharophilum DSM 2985 TaxID=907348 RepID=H7EJG6_9SPIR|nr:hypothetical protein TresaDRAFT_1591 [Treponema saccharophilum DSM 2985]